ncbi:MAG: thermonuclease family protein [Halarchaeum sp.]
MSASRRALLVVVVCALCVSAGCAAGPLGGTADGTTGGGAGSAGSSTVGGATNGTVAGPGWPNGSTLNATVVDVADGDTVDVRLANGTEDTVRLLGVDTPEVWVDNTPSEFRGVPDTEAGRTCLRAWGENASAYTKARLDGARVTLAFDPNTDRRGAYGRLLAYVVTNGTTQNYALVREGYARVYTSGFTRQDAYLDAADAAYDARRGLWHCADGSGGSTTETGSSSGGASALSVRVHADASGPDGENLNDEYVVLRNGGDDSVALGGATVTDAAGHEYVFPGGVSLASDESLTLHTGSGTDGDGNYYWGADGPIWNNDGDTAVVRSAAGETLARTTYG